MIFRIQCLVCRTKFAQQTGSPLPAPLDPCTPTKSGLRTGSKGTPDVQAPCPEPLKVTFSVELDLLAELYYTCISGKEPQDGINVPCINPNRLVIPFVTYNLGFQKILSRTFSWSSSLWSSYWLLSPHILVKMNWRNPVQQIQVWTKFKYALRPRNVVTCIEIKIFVSLVCYCFPDSLERCYLRQVHNCVYFAVKLLESQFQWVLYFVHLCPPPLLLDHLLFLLTKFFFNPFGFFSSHCQIGGLFGQGYFASTGREWKGGVFLPGPQGPVD